MSDRIRVVSIIGRFLEHSRMWSFTNGGNVEYYMGSSDWMPRNFDRRVEAVVPIEDATLHARLARLIDTYLSDHRQGWDLDADGVWHQRHCGDGCRGSHEVLLRDSWGAPAVVRDVPIRAVEGSLEPVVG